MKEECTMQNFQVPTPGKEWYVLFNTQFNFKLVKVLLFKAQAV